MRRPRFFLVLLVLLMGKASVYRYLAYGDRNPLHVLLLEAPAVLLGLGLLRLLSPRENRWPLAVAYVAASVFLLGSAGYVVYFGTLVTPAVLSFTRQLDSLRETVAELWSPIYLLFLIDLPVVMYFAAARAPSRSRVKRPRAIQASRVLPAQTTRRRVTRADVDRARLVTALVIAGIVVVGQILSAMRLPAAADPTLVARLRGTAIAQVASVLRPAPDSIANAVAGRAQWKARSGNEPPADETPAEQLERLVREARGPITGARLVGFERGAYQGAPIILVQVEALQTMDVDAKIDGRAVTPNLSAFAKRSHYWPNMVPQLSRGNTSDVEWTVNSGMNPPVSSAACLEYAGKAVPALPRLLGRQQGYATFTAHANDAVYWNRSRLYPAMGFGRFYDKQYFGRSDAMWSGVSDEVFLEKSLKFIRAANAVERPFYANLITLSSHQPYGYVPVDRRPLKLTPAQADTVVGRHLGAISYTDKALGVFLGKLDDAGVLDRAIIVIIGDHWAIQPKDVSTPASQALVDQLIGRDYTAADKLKVPLMIHLPGQSDGSLSEETVGQVDIAPTLADAVGLNLSGVPMVGRSMFERHSRLVQTRTGAPGGSFANDRVIHLAGLTFADGTAIDVADGSPARQLPADKADFERAAMLSTLCDEWLRLLPDRSTAGDAASAAVIPNRK